MGGLILVAALAAGGAFIYWTRELDEFWVAAVLAAPFLHYLI